MGFFGAIAVVWMVIYHRNGLVDQFLDILQVSPFLCVAKRQGDPAGVGPSCPADAVDIGLRDVGQIVIDHMR